MNWRRLANPAFLTALAVLAASALGMSAAIRGYGIYLRKLAIYAEGDRTLNALPKETRLWKCVGVRVESPEVLEELGTENYATMVFERKEPLPDGRRPRLELHCAYYTNMIDTVPHVAERCLVGAGLDLVATGILRPLELDSGAWIADPEVPEDLKGRIWRTQITNEFSSSRGQRPRLFRDPHDLTLLCSEYRSGPSRLFAGYFFVANGGTVASAEQVRLLAFNLTDDYAYYMKVQVNSSAVGSAEELASLASELLSDLIGDIMLCVPDWVKVQAGEYPADNPRKNRS